MRYDPLWVVRRQTVNCFFLPVGIILLYCVSEFVGQCVIALGINIGMKCW